MTPARHPARTVFREIAEHGRTAASPGPTRVTTLMIRMADLPDHRTESHAGSVR